MQHLLGILGIHLGQSQCLFHTGYAIRVVQVRNGILVHEFLLQSLPILFQQYGLNGSKDGMFALFVQNALQATITTTTMGCGSYVQTANGSALGFLNVLGIPALHALIVLLVVPQVWMKVLVMVLDGVQFGKGGEGDGLCFRRFLVGWNCRLVGAVFLGDIVRVEDAIAAGGAGHGGGVGGNLLFLLLVLVLL